MYEWKKKMWLFFLFPVFTVLMFCFPAFAEESSAKQVMVELEAIAEEKDYFKPNELAGYKLTLKNKLESAWIRVKFDLSGKNIDQEFADKDLNIQDGWVKTYGWYKAEERIWYYCHEISDGSLGKLVKGWHEDSQDGQQYFLDWKTGIMLSGWQEIDGDEYYFAVYEEIPQQTWFWKIFGDSGLGKWIYGQLGYRSYGSLYINEKTPDGQSVDEAGRKK